MHARRFIRRLGSAIAVLGLLLTAAPALAGSETPPAGPPWVRTLVEAQKKAVKAQVPIFVYLTKTH